MSAVQIYGIKNCDTMKKAFKYLDTHNIDYDFHDYKKMGIDEEVIKEAIKEHGWQNVINQRGTTWRQLTEDVKNSMDDAGALQAAHDNASIIKRPLLVYKNTSYLGFKEDLYQSIFV